jgi:hypothetical protein
MLYHARETRPERYADDLATLDVDILVAQASRARATAGNAG